MPDLQQEEAALALADRHIAEGEQRIDALIERTKESEAAGRDTTTPERLLLLMRETLDQWHVHRRLILDAIARCER
ncbi:hypothetical protein VQ03_07620 [Methylobacterium tarhaniae]|uniref:Uncharacterized protein n=1 Tax=Methylobacterium tarhaniae TaxID=1187852 RepID=A0A0J6T881_9HYPH|nr:hypothetical protein [Methylobacterium tarhaniae]KMO43600.1 hypothetical protein VQ03_07620 [Methylobacterium tarhaniae]